MEIIVIGNNGTNSSFINSGNDAIDVSGSIIELQNIFINGVGDKALSAGENSRMTAHQIEIKNAVKLVHDDAAWLYLGSVKTIFAARKELKGCRNIGENLWLGDAYKEK